MLLVSASASVQALEVKLAFLGTADSAAHRGAQQGLAEAQAQGEFLGLAYTLELIAPGAPLPAGTTAVVVAATAPALQAAVAAYKAVPVLNAALTDDTLRRLCQPNLFHTQASTEMLRDAEAQWRKANPQGPAARAQAWHPDFTRYAAAQLNKRYQHTFKEPMTDEAWAGWAAVKLLSDTVAREQTAEGAALLTALRERLAFDGQKGVDLSFRADGQLRQPLLLVVDGALAGEAPVRGVVDIEDLDSLGRVECLP
ncbi:MAG: hypothetical protein RL434_1554 [Pseudomonadota bacterium]|jgi:ABC-type branched-subunit amino acid transport system substrate-binding protein